MTQCIMCGLKLQCFRIRRWKFKHTHSCPHCKRKTCLECISAQELAGFDAKCSYCNDGTIRPVVRKQEAAHLREKREAMFSLPAEPEIVERIVYRNNPINHIIHSPRKTRREDHAHILSRRGLHRRYGGK